MQPAKQFFIQNGSFHGEKLQLRGSLKIYFTMLKGNYDKKNN